MVRGIRGNRLAGAAVAAAIAASGCGSSGGTSSATRASPSPAARLTGPLTVLAAASLTEAFKDTKTTLEKANAGLQVTYSFAGSQALVTQVVNGAPADVVATADETTMSRLVTAALVEAPTVFAHNRLEIAVAPGNPRGIRGLADLAAPSLTVVLADPSVPAGRFAQQALQKAAVTVTPRSLELDVKSVLQKVAIGEADAGVVYVTDVTAAGATVAGVPIPDAQNVIATYPIAVVKATTHHAAAAAFVTEVVSGSGQQALRKHGFLGP
ncbi:MAG TPA: molybdate ABC transporter substrate-binding protein [Candidatus Dormibacteraeota bacterium]|nr:molybdate ABC transporter substrate-binding protein [Candidatus Dormibacteraeota bacterium]